MSKALEALHRVKPFKFVNKVEELDYTFLEKALEDFEWLKSKIDIDFVYRLPTDDRIKLIEILGVKL